MLYAPDSLILAPLSGFTDLPYRRAARACGCFYAFTEMVDVSSLAYSREQSRRMLARGDDEPWLGVQIVGSDPEHTKRAVDILNDYNFDVLDLNLGCPVPKVARKGAGAELGRNVRRALELFGLIKDRTRFPVSAKIRIADAVDTAPTLELVQGLAELGAAAVTVHGRVKEQIYSGPVDFGQIRRCAELDKVQIVANGGVASRATCDELRQKTACRCVMLARGAMGNPWLFREIADREDYRPPTIDELLELMTRHIQEMCGFYGELPAMRMARKIVHDYLKGRGFGGEAKSRASRLCSFDEFRTFTDYLRGRHSGEHYWHMIELNPGAERRLRKE